MLPVTVSTAHLPINHPPYIHEHACERSSWKTSKNDPNQ
uniref:Uncharacterized protein n=1 Tax=Anguilla anguilla TaxID=7936 RepID=A0A0E9URT9_ANGAN